MIRMLRHQSVGQALVWSALAAIGLVPRPVMAQSGIDACINPAGQVRMLASGDFCREQEQLVTWAIQGPAGPAGPQGQPGASGPVVVDSTGAQLGWYMSPLVMMNIDNQWFTVLVNRDGFSSPSLGTFFAFLTSDCTGQRYGTAAGAGLVANAQVLHPYAWFADLDAPPVVITGTPEAPGTFWFQQETASGPIGPCSPSAVIGSISLSPMRSVDISAFMPPFRVTN